MHFTLSLRRRDTKSSTREYARTQGSIFTMTTYCAVGLKAGSLAVAATLAGVAAGGVTGSSPALAFNTGG
jgi:hypothetical protein